jgi:hypothetical protein
MIRLQTKPQVTAPGGAYAYGNIKDDTTPGSNDGTPVNKEVYADFHQFFETLIAQSSVTANDLPDNDSNGYQLLQAFLEVINMGGFASAAQGGTAGFNTESAPTMTPDTGTVSSISITSGFNKWRLQNTTLIWQIKVSCTIAGTPNYIDIPLPNNPFSINGWSFANRNHYQRGNYAGATLFDSLVVIVGPPGGGNDKKIRCFAPGGFQNAGSQILDITVIAEISG